MDLAPRTPSTVDSAETNGKQQAAATLESTDIPSSIVTPVPSATYQPSSTPVLFESPTHEPTETLEPTMSLSPEPSYTPSAFPTVEPKPTPDGLLIEILSLTSPVVKSDNASLIAKTVPGAICEITVYYKSGPSKAKGLDPITADDSGKVSWTWKVGSSTTSGNWRIVVKAHINGQEITKELYFLVQ
ncbi:MAG: hypothetical protein ACYCZF_08730 [Anaerolineae bacterium]